MKNFKEKMENLDVPELNNDPLQNKLKRKLIHTYFRKENNYKKLFKIAVGFCLLFFATTVIFLANPNIPHKIHTFAFEEMSSNLVHDTKNQTNLHDEAIKYTSINNPKFEQNIQPYKYEEENAYLIRQYSSRENEGVIVVSKFDNDEKQITTNQIY